MFYPKAKDKKLNDELFKNPTSEYRGAPFWAWNGKLTPENIEEEIDYFEEMGFGGYYMHPRTGLDNEYLGEDYFKCIEACIKKSEKKNMKAYLYDEDRWPSGFAGGKVTCDRKLAQRKIRFTPLEQLELDEDNTELARYDIELENGYLKSYKRISENEKGENVWVAVLSVSPITGWHNRQAYVDTLNPDAIKKFCEITYAEYEKRFNKYFGNVVPTIFTDEPQFARETQLAFADSRMQIVLPFTEKLADKYKEKYGVDFYDIIPELVWDKTESEAPTYRYYYHDLLTEMFATAFSDTLGEWCGNNNIAFTGHMMNEPGLDTQSVYVGECMRSYRKYQIPGIDMLAELREYTTAKQAQSAVHQYGREGMMSELYGVANWDYDFKKHKMQGDWQTALGVTHRVPHLAFYSMHGNAKRDYPAPIFYQSPWYKEYKYIEDYFSRVNTALTRGKPDVKIGVIHPIESYWLHMGPNDTSNSAATELKNAFLDVTKWLLLSQLDFDFISEALLPEQYENKNNSQFTIGKMDYDVVVVPNCETIRSTTLSALKDFVSSGGKVIFTGVKPKYIDGVSNTDAQKFIGENDLYVNFTKNELVKALEAYRTVDIYENTGVRSDSKIYQLRDDNDCKWLFVCNANKPADMHKINATVNEIRIKGKYSATEYCALTGEIKPRAVKYKNGNTCINQVMYAQDSLLLKLTEDDSSNGVIDYSKGYEEFTRASQPESITMSEPNVLLLDLAEYRFDNGDWQPLEDVLKIRVKYKKLLGYLDDGCQPWAQTESPVIEHDLTLRYKINSEIDVQGAYLAVEDVEDNTYYLNGKEIEKNIDGYYVDKCYSKLKLPALQKGENIIEIKIPFGAKTTVEWAYLLGDFDVETNGYTSKILAKSNNIVYGNIVGQGMPFYGGNITYNSDFETEDGKYAIRVSTFGSPVLKVIVDGKDMGDIAFFPHTLDLGNLTAGTHKLQLVAYGNRYNSFGDIHSNLNKECIGPNGWFTEGGEYTYEYQFRNAGIIATPEILKVTQKEIK